MNNKFFIPLKKIRMTVMAYSFQNIIPILLLYSLLLFPSNACTEDGEFLLRFKSKITNDPLSVLANWNFQDQTPCSWFGVSCDSNGDVIGLLLQNNQFSGTLASELGLIKNLQHLDLSKNLFNGSLPLTILEAKELKTLDLSYNLFSGEISDSFAEMKNLHGLKLDHNDLSGKIPSSLANHPTVTEILLRYNKLDGDVPGGFERVEVFDVSKNVINGSLPESFGGENLRFLNMSGNKISGGIPVQFAERISADAIVDLSFNNLTGEVPDSRVFKVEFLTGNSGLCGELVNRSCITSNTPPTNSTPPSTSGSTPTTTAPPPNHIRGKKTTRPRYLGYYVGVPIVFVFILIFILLFVFRLCKKKKRGDLVNEDSEEISTPIPVATNAGSWPYFRGNDIESPETIRSDTEEEVEDEMNLKKTRLSLPAIRTKEISQQMQENNRVVSVDGDIELDLETLLNAPANKLNPVGPNIVLKIMIGNEKLLAVRQIRESNVENSDFVKRVGLISNLRHLNLLHLRAYYSDDQHKLIMYDYLPNGSLANYGSATLGRKKLRWEARLKVARGVARALIYLHENKHVHGNLKPSNILLDLDMEPKLADFGLETLISYHGRIIQSSGEDMCSPYYAPEYSRSFKPNSKWDVYSFGIIFLELLTGRVFDKKELTQWSDNRHWQEPYWFWSMIDRDILPEVDGMQTALVTCFNVAFSSASLVQDKRPTMKHVLQKLDGIPSPSVYRVIW